MGWLGQQLADQPNFFSTFTFICNSLVTLLQKYLYTNIVITIIRFSVHKFSVVLENFVNSNPHSFKVGEIFIIEGLDVLNSAVIIAVLQYWAENKVQYFQITDGR